MQLQNITLMASHSNWRLFMIRKADPAFQKFAQKALERDQHTCQYCGFTASKNLDVINRDADYRNNKLANLITACSLCAQCFFLEAVGKGEFGGGSLVYLPNMSQSELNAFCHVLFTATITGNSYAIQAKNIYRGLRLQSQIIEKEVGEGFSNPFLYGRLMIEIENEASRKLHDSLLPHIRLLPDIGRFAHQVRDWVNDSLEWLATQ